MAAIAAHENLPPRSCLNVGGKWGDFGTSLGPTTKIASQACPAYPDMVLMGEYIIVFKAEKIEPGARREEFESGLGQFPAADPG